MHGHCNVRRSTSQQANAPHVSLAKWCSLVRTSRNSTGDGKSTSKTLKLSQDKIETLNALGFQWELKDPCFDSKKSPFEKRFDELKVFKTEFGHCNVSHSKSESNRPYISLAGWCDLIRKSRKQMEEGNAPKVKQRLKLSQHQIDRLDAFGFVWTRQSTFDKRYDELKAFEAKFGHCNVSHSQACSNKPYTSLARWCSQIRLSRKKQLDKGKKPMQLELSQAQIERLNALGFRW